MSESVQTIELGRRESTPRSYDLDMMTQSGSDDYEIKAWKPGWLDGGSGSDKQALRGGDQRGWLEEIFKVDGRNISRTTRVSSYVTGSGTFLLLVPSLLCCIVINSSRPFQHASRSSTKHCGATTAQAERFGPVRGW